MPIGTLRLKENMFSYGSAKWMSVEFCRVDQLCMQLTQNTGWSLSLSALLGELLSHMRLLYISIRDKRWVSHGTAHIITWDDDMLWGRWTVVVSKLWVGLESSHCGNCGTAEKLAPPKYTEKTITSFSVIQIVCFVALFVGTSWDSWELLY